jgi:hypothetical protein
LLIGSLPAHLITVVSDLIEIDLLLAALHCNLLDFIHNVVQAVIIDEPIGQLPTLVEQKVDVEIVNDILLELLLNVFVGNHGQLLQKDVDVLAFTLWRNYRLFFAKLSTHFMTSWLVRFETFVGFIICSARVNFVKIDRLSVFDYLLLGW